MKKYLLSAAYELDGHGGSTSCYFQQDSELTEAQARALIAKVFDTDGTVFEERHMKFGERSAFYGDLVTKYSEQLTLRTPISISIVRLPTRFATNRIYLTESRTG